MSDSQNSDSPENPENPNVPPSDVTPSIPGSQEISPSSEDPPTIQSTPLSAASSAEPLEHAPLQETSAPVPPELVAVPPTRTSTPIGRRFKLTLVLIALVFALLGGTLLLAGYNTGQAKLQPALAAQAFCEDLLAHHYAAAYSLLSSSYKAKETATQFIKASQLQDQVDGEVRDCPTATNPGIDLSFSAPQDYAAYVATILRNKPFTGHISLVRQAGAWKVEAIEQSLAGTNLGPLLVANTFCEAIIQGDYTTAYNTLSSRQQSLAPEQVFAQQFSSAFGGSVRLNSCTMNYATYTVRPDTAAIAVSFDLTISTSAAGSMTTSLLTVLSFTQANGVWNLDDFAPQPSAG